MTVRICECGKMVFHGDEHFCQPKWEIIPDWEDEKYYRYGYDPEIIAATWAKEYDKNNDQYIYTNKPAIKITNSNGEVFRYQLSGEHDIKYNASIRR